MGNKYRQLKPIKHRQKNSVADLITNPDGLGYCCPYFFFLRYRKVKADLVAARLGVQVRAIRRHKAAFLAGEIGCEGCESCLLAPTTAESTQGR